MTRAPAGPGRCPSAQKWGGGISRYLGVDQAHPLDTSVSTAVDETTTNTALTVPGVTTQTDGAMVIGGIGMDAADYDDHPAHRVHRTVGERRRQGSRTGLPVPARPGPTGARTWTISAPRAVGGWMTALRPATGTALLAPTASFTASPVSGTAPLQVGFTDTSGGVPTSWLWDFGDGATSTAQNPSHTYTSPGSYTVSLKATNAAGSDTITKTSAITVQAPPAAGVVTFGSATSAAATTATTDLTLAKPAQSAVGDVLVASFTVDNKPTVTVPAGWTSVLSATLKPASASSMFAYYHVVTAADDTRTGWTWTLSAAQRWGGGITRYLGVDQAHPLDTSVSTAVDNTTTNTALTVPGVTTQTDGAMVIGGIGMDGATITTTPPTGFTEPWESVGGKAAEQAYLSQPTPGPTGARTWTISAPRAVGGWMTALRPATG